MMQFKSEIFEISDLASGENQGGQEKSASRICQEPSRVHQSNKVSHNQIYSNRDRTDPTAKSLEQ